MKNFLTLILAIVFVLSLAACGGETTTNVISETNEELETAVEEKLSFELVAGEAGEYGEKLTFNKGTDMEIVRWYYHIPIGTYKVTNVGEYMSPISVYVDEIHKNEEGLEEPVIATEAEMLAANKSTTITVEDGQVIYISEPAVFLFEMQ